MSWTAVISIIKLIIGFFWKPEKAAEKKELKKLMKRLQEIKNEQARTNSSARFNILDTERVQVVKRIADIHRSRKTSISITKE